MRITHFIENFQLYEHDYKNNNSTLHYSADTIEKVKNFLKSKFKNISYEEFEAAREVKCIGADKFSFYESFLLEVCVKVHTPSQTREFWVYNRYQKYENV
ncbi:hypothetical protein [uncultured Helicobacter sp.]|uniref:hypothetical protein n=1 Tax=uncultured Helicobacter sp. TaxID=175537 RepID=UPI002605718A|nr:hypothetical protein [uncultured Helicobacter sp.]